MKALVQKVPYSVLNVVTLNGISQRENVRMPLKDNSKYAVFTYAPHDINKVVFFLEVYKFETK